VFLKAEELETSFHSDDADLDDAYAHFEIFAAEEGARREREHRELRRVYTHTVYLYGSPDGCDFLK